jgi:hypothetical protein
VENDAGVNIAESIKHLVVFDYAKRIILWNNIPIPVIETEKINEKMASEQVNDK